MRTYWTNHWRDDRFALEYETNFYPRRQEEFGIIRTYLDRRGTILEAGCGYGQAAKYFQECGYRIIGLDYAAPALEIGRHHAPDLRLVRGDVHALPFPDESLSAYLSFGVLEHFETGPLPALREAFRVLAPGGIAAITLPLPTHFLRETLRCAREWLRLGPIRRNALVRRVLRKLPVASAATSSEFHEQPYSREQVRDCLDRAGFEVLCQRPIYNSYWFFLLGRPFRDPSGYFRENALCEILGRVAGATVPWQTAFFSLAIGRKH